jgi:hypothetical protein
MKPTDNYAVTARRDPNTSPVDDFPTPPWATRALIEHVIKPRGRVWEPACGRCYMSKPLKEHFGSDNVFSTDIIDYGSKHQDGVLDFLRPRVSVSNANWMITNPPFKNAEWFVKQALGIGIPNVAVLVRTQFLEGIGRFGNLWSWKPPSIVAQFAERVPMVQGRVDQEATTATAYCWIVWADGVREPTRMIWIPPCRRQLEKQNDYI